MPPFGRAVTPMVVPYAVSLTGCSGSPASCCSSRRCSTPPTTRGQRRSPEPPPKATRLDPLHRTQNSDHVAEHWSLISGRKSHHSPITVHQPLIQRGTTGRGAEKSASPRRSSPERCRSTHHLKART